MPIQISSRIVEIVHNYVVRRLVALEGIMYLGTISGSLDRIFHGFGNGTTYHKTLDKAGAILYAIVNGHSFSDGNKRTGLLTTYLFLSFNGYSLVVPKNTAQFLERMADAADPNAPTEEDAIEWVKCYAKGGSFLAVVTYLALTFFCKIFGDNFLEFMTIRILEEGEWVGLEKEKLVDKTWLKHKEPPITCSSEYE
jgi:death-on-curing family protein